MAENVNDILLYVEETLQKADVWKNNSHIIVGVSGGADSVALLLCLKLLKQKGGYRLTACHINHGLRENAKNDEEHVYYVCEEMKVPLIIKQANLSGTMNDSGIETKAREERIKLFSRALIEEKADVICLAHHQDDQAETVLMHLLRGAGGTGAMGIAEVSYMKGYKVVRPLLNISKNQLIEFLLEEDISYVEDESNQWLCTTRNRVRHKLLRECEEIYPTAKKQLANFAKRQSVDESYLNSEMLKYYKRALLDSENIFAIECKEILPIHEALQRRVFRKFYVEALKKLNKHPKQNTLTEKFTLDLVTLLYSQVGATVNLPCNLMAVRGKEHIHMRTQQNNALVEKENTENSIVNFSQANYEVLGICFELKKMGKFNLEKGQSFIVLSQEWENKELLLRPIHSNDFIHPFSKKSIRPLRRVLIDAKIDYAFRKNIVVLAQGNEVLWIPGVMASEKTRIKNLNQPCYRLSLCDGLPWLKCENTIIEGE